MNKIQDRKIFLGVDPSFTNLGLCVHDPEKETLNLFTGDFMQAISWMNRNVNLSEIIVVIENPALDKPTFAYGMVKPELLKMQRYDKWKATKKGIPPAKSTIDDVMSKVSIVSKISQNVGESKASAKLLKKIFHDKGVPVIEIPPSKRERADKLPKVGAASIDPRQLKMPTKMNAKQFATFCGYTEPCSEHARDAASLVWGRTLRSAYLHFAREAESNGEPVDPKLLYIVKAKKPKPKKRQLPF